MAVDMPCWLFAGFCSLQRILRFEGELGLGASRHRILKCVWPSRGDETQRSRVMFPIVMIAIHIPNGFRDVVILITDR